MRPGPRSWPATAPAPRPIGEQPGQSGHPKKGTAPDTCEACGAATRGPLGNVGRLRCVACALAAARLIACASPLEGAGGLLVPTERDATDAVPTPLPAYPLTCPEALALELGGGAAYAVDWADELAALTSEELDAYAARFAGGGPMSRAAILEARYRRDAPADQLADRPTPPPPAEASTGVAT